MKSGFIRILCLVCLLGLANCTGNECSALDDFVSDGDADCTPDASDNCPLVYNPNQFDADGDGIGELCDADDTSSAVASISDEPAENISNPIFFDENGELNDNYYDQIEVIDTLGSQ